MQAFLEYVWANKQWLFSGGGVTALVCLGGLVRWLFLRRNCEGRTSVAAIRTELPQADSRGAPTKLTGGERVPREWQGILPAESKYEFVSEERSEIPLGLQSFSFEYGPHGHTGPLHLKNAVVRAEIQFDCRIANVHKAMFAANDFALNVLPPRFLLGARSILEGYSLGKLKEKRPEASATIVAFMAPQFEQLGVRLESVAIGALEKLWVPSRKGNERARG